MARSNYGIISQKGDISLAPWMVYYNVHRNKELRRNANFLNITENVNSLFFCCRKAYVI